MSNDKPLTNNNLLQAVIICANTAICNYTNWSSKRKDLLAQ